MVKWTLKFNNKANKDAKLLKTAGLKQKTNDILAKIESNPFLIPPPFEKLSGMLSGFISRRINRQHRIVYEVSEGTNEIFVYAMYRHYQD